MIDPLRARRRAGTIDAMDLDPAHLRSLQAIVRYGGYHRAAEALHLTQPAVSRHIRRLEEQLGQPLFAREGRGVRLTAFGERAVSELSEILAAHDRALERLLDAEQRPFVLGAIEHIVDPMLPGVLSVLREQLAGRALTLRVDRSAVLARAVADGELDAAISLVPDPVSDPVSLGSLTLRWWRGAGLPDPDPLTGPVPLVAYDEPCMLRELALDALRRHGAQPQLTAESPHMTGVHAATRNSLGYSLLAEGADGLSPVRHGPLTETFEVPVWLLLAPAHRGLAAPLRAASWRAMKATMLAGAA